MLNIMFKDLYQARKTILLYLALGLVYILSTIRTEAGIAMSVGFIFLMIYGVVARNEYVEEKNRGYSLLRTLPLKPYKIVMSKYMAAIVLAVISVIYYGLMALLFGSNVADIRFMISILLVGAGFALIFTGILYIFIYKYGAARAINLSRIFFLGFWLIPVVFSTILEKVPKPSFIESGKLEMFLESIAADFSTLSLLFVGISLIIYFLTMIASISQFKKNKIM